MSAPSSGSESESPGHNRAEWMSSLSNNNEELARKLASDWERAQSTVTQLQGSSDELLSTFVRSSRERAFDLLERAQVRRTMPL